LWCSEQGSGGTTTITCTPITNNTWYFITGNCTASGADTLDLYNVSGTSQIATSSLTDNGCAAGALNYFAFGAVGNEASVVQTDAYYSNVIFDLANATFPLLPPQLVSCVPSLALLGVGRCD
jgi:hypothetical protein